MEPLLEPQTSFFQEMLNVDDLFHTEAARKRHSHELKTLRAQVWKSKQRGAGCTSKIGAFSKLEILILLALSGDARIAVEYLQWYKKRYHKMTCSMDELTLVVEDLVIELPQEDFNMMLFLETAMHI